MNRERRRLLIVGGGALAALAMPFGASAATTVEIEMRGSPRGERVWFQPNGLAVDPGTTIRWVNKDPGNSHTATAYATKIDDRQQRIPDAATPWDSGLLLPDQSFEVTLTVPGVYDYYCQPHEAFGMVGRILVGRPGEAGWQGPAPDSDDLPEAALAALPSVEDILTHGPIIPKEAEAQ